MDAPIKFIKRPKLKNVHFLAAWPGMGDVAFRAVTYLIEKLPCEEFASLDTPEFFPPDGVEIENQDIFIPRQTGGRYYFYSNKNKDYDIVIFVHDRQPLANLSYKYAKKVLDIANFLKIKRVFTFAGLPAPIDHLKVPDVFAVATKKEALKSIKPLGLKPMRSGQISGLNGLLLGAAKVLNIEGICLLSEVPFYTIHIENPLASLAVLRAFSKILNLNIELEDLFQEANSLEMDVDKIIDYLKSSITSDPIDEGDVEKIKKMLSSYVNLPHSAKKSIENLFKQVEEDISKANMLKNELDKWNVYNEYEDRFLDLFKSRGSKNEEQK